MTDQGIHIFFDNFGKNLDIIKEENDLSRARQRAQVMLAQLTFFKEACLGMRQDPQSDDHLALTALLEVKGIDSFFHWLLEKQKVFTIQNCLYRAERTTWRILRGDNPVPVAPEALEWIETGLYARKEFEDWQFFHFFVVGEVRLILGGEKKNTPDLSLFLKLVAFAFPRVTSVFEEVKEASFLDANLIAKDQSSIELLENLKKAAVTDVTILLEGESGTGKEIIANFIHQNSSRKRKNFVAVNCAAIPDGLIESELFGHEKGAFTGAVQRHIGKVESADQGTLFLDEIGEMDLKAQAKLLRFIQLKEFHRVGGKEKMSVNVRILAATNRDLRRAVQEQVFRDDLFFRLSVMPFQIPPLRQRPGDLLPLFHHFLKQYAKEFNLPLPQVAPHVYEILYAHPFSGNIRELQNLVQNMLVQSQGERITRRHLPANMIENLESSPLKLSRFLVELEEEDEVAEAADAVSFQRAGRQPQTNDELKSAKQSIQDQAKEAQLLLEKEFLLNLLQSTGWVIPEASKRSGINRTMLYKMMDRNGIKP